MSTQWLKDAVFYEIYPQSFYDTNGDGIGDFNGIIEKLDYIKSLGCNALWINPCFDSPFKDAGYDVRDYKKAAPRYGTNEDLVRLFATRDPKSITTVALLDKDVNKPERFNVDYYGFRIPDEFVVGYGLDYADYYRNLPYIAVIKEECYR